MSRSCSKCNNPLEVRHIKWGRDTVKSDWFVHVGTTETPICPKEDDSD